MSYFPVSLKFDDKKVLLVGGGSIALFKLKKLAAFSPASLTCVSKSFSEDFRAEITPGMILKEKAFETSDLEGMDIVIVAIEDLNLQESIYNICREKRILCNCVDLIHCCDFIFPSIIKRGDIVVAITSNGRVPGFSAVFKDYLEKYVPADIENGFMEALKLRQSLPRGPERMKMIRAKAQQFFDKIAMSVMILPLALTLFSCSTAPVSLNGSKIYVVEREREALFVLDQGKEKIIKDLGNLNHATMKFDNGYGYVLARDGFISKINIDKDELVKKVKIGKSGIGITFIDKYIAVVNYDPQSVVLLDKDLNIIKTVETQSRNVGIKSYKDYLVFSLMDKNQIMVLDAKKDFAIVKTFEDVGQLPFDALIKEDKYIVGFFNEAAIGILNLSSMQYEKLVFKDTGDKLVMKVPHFGYWGVVGNTAIVPLAAEKKLLVLDLTTSKALKEIPLIGNPVFASVSPDKKKLIVNYSGDQENLISVVDIRSLEKEADVEAGRRVMHLRFSPDGKKAYVTSYFDNSLKTIDTSKWKVVDERKVATPSGIFISGAKE